MVSKIEFVGPKKLKGRKILIHFIGKKGYHSKK